MDYERRRVKWYWITLFVCYCTTVVYFVLTGNPFLYSNQEFRKRLLAVPEGKVEPVPSAQAQASLNAHLGDQTYYSRLNGERNGDSSSTVTYGKNFVEKDVIPLSIDEDFHPVEWATDEDGIFMAGTDAAIAFGWDGVKSWEFHFPPSHKALAGILTDGALTYLITPVGQAVAVNKKTGTLQWDLRLDEEVVGPCVLSKDDLLIPLKAHSGDAKALRPAFRWAVVKRSTGELEHYSKVIDVRPKFQFTNASELGLWVLSVENKLTAIDPETFETVWTQTLTDPIQGPASIAGDAIYVSSMAGKVVKLDGAKKGRQDWETELIRPPVSAPSYLPVMTKLSFIDDQGQLQTVDAKSGKLLWKYNLENKSDLKETWSARLKGSVIQETAMNWAYKGWTIWTPCSKNRLCIFNPDKGQLINRIQVSGSLLSFPFDRDRALYFLIDQGKTWAISRLEVQKKGTASSVSTSPASTPATQEKAVD